MGCTLFGKLLIAFLCVHFGSTCPDPACQNTLLQKMLSVKNANDFCRFSNDFIDCVKASCNMTEFPQEVLERINTILSVQGIQCDFTGQDPSTLNPIIDSSTRMAEINCWGECQASFERALVNTPSTEQICRNIDMLFSCIRNKCHIDKLPYSTLQAFREKLDFLTSSCDLTKHFDGASSQAPVTQLITQMEDFFIHVTSTQSTVTQISTQMTDMLDIFKSSTTTKTAASYAKIHDNTKNNRAGTQSLSFLTFIVGCFVAVLL